MGALARLSDAYGNSVTVPLPLVLALVCAIVVIVTCFVRCRASMHRSAWRMRYAHEGMGEEGRSLLSAERIAAVMAHAHRAHGRGNGW